MRPTILVVLKHVLGWKTYARHLTATLAGRDDADVAVLSLGPARAQSAFLKRHNTGGVWEWARRVDPIDAYRGYLGRAIRREVRRTAPHVVHFAPHWPAAAIAYDGGFPPFTTALDCTRANIQRMRETRAWPDSMIRTEGGLLRRAARLYPMSGWAAGSLIDDFVVPAERIEVMPPSVAIGSVRVDNRRNPLPKVLFVGNHFVRKGGDRLCEWMRGPLRQRCEFHIVSADPRARITGQGIVSHGSVSNDVVRRLMAECDIFCLPTRSDMSPQVLSEAAAAGLACVASDLGGIPDLVVHGRTGLLVRPDDDAAFVSALTRLIDDGSLREAMRAAALEHAATLLDADRTFGRLVDDLVALAADPREARSRAARFRSASSLDLAGTA